MPPVHSIWRDTNEIPHEIHLAGLEDVHYVLSHQVTVLLTEPLGIKDQQMGDSPVHVTTTPKVAN